MCLQPKLKKAVQCYLNHNQDARFTMKVRF